MHKFNEIDFHVVHMSDQKILIRTILFVTLKLHFISLQKKKHFSVCKCILCHISVSSASKQTFGVIWESCWISKSSISSPEIACEFLEYNPSRLAVKKVIKKPYYNNLPFYDIKYQNFFTSNIFCSISDFKYLE